MVASNTEEWRSDFDVIVYTSAHFDIICAPANIHSELMEHPVHSPPTNLTRHNWEDCFTEAIAIVTFFVSLLIFVRESPSEFCWRTIREYKGEKLE